MIFSHPLVIKEACGEIVQSLIIPPLEKGEQNILDYSLVGRPLRYAPCAVLSASSSLQSYGDSFFLEVGFHL